MNPDAEKPLFESPDTANPEAFTPAAGFEVRTPPSPAGSMSLLARCLLDRHLRRAREMGHPVVVELRFDGADDFSERILDGTASLLGYTAHAQADAVAVVATGQVRMLDRSLELPTSLAACRSSGVALACVVARDGEVGWYACAGSIPLGLPAPREGWLLDCLRRGLELATSPPAMSPGVLGAPLWVESIRQVVCDHPGRLPWSGVLKAIPALPSDWCCDPAAQQSPVVWEQAWETLRIAVTKGLRSPWFPSSTAAAWMDTGMFARFVFEMIPPGEDLAASLRAHLAPGASRRLVHELRRILMAGRAVP